MANTKQSNTATVEEIVRGSLKVYVEGTSPLIMHSMSAKVRGELLAPKGKKTAADKAASLKHNPIEEFNGTLYRTRLDTAPTALMMPATAFKAAMMTAALDLSNYKKASVGRQIYVAGDEVPIWGIPELFMAVARSGDMSKTPDIRTRAILPKWCALLTIHYVSPLVRDQDILTLLTGAGFTAGVGDWRIEKGSGSYGAFQLANEEDVTPLMQTAGREAQLAAIQNPQCYNPETEELLAYWRSEAKRRGFEV